MFYLLVKLWSIWSNTLKHKSLGIESQCMMGGRTSTLPCPYLSAETKYGLSLEQCIKFGIVLNNQLCSYFFFNFFFFFNRWNLRLQFQAKAKTAASKCQSNGCLAWASKHCTRRCRDGSPASPLRLSKPWMWSWDICPQWGLFFCMLGFSLPYCIFICSTKTV